MWMPSSWLDSRFDDTARNARPIFVLFSSSVTRKTATSTVIQVNRSAYSISAPSSANVSLRPGNSDGKARPSNAQMTPAMALRIRNSDSVTMTIARWLRRVERPDQHPFDAAPRRSPTGPCAMSTASEAGDVEGVGDGVGDERADHGHLALGEVDDAGRLEDQDEGERHRRVDEAVAEAVEDPLEEQLRPAVVDRPDAERRPAGSSPIDEPELAVVADPARSRMPCETVLLRLLTAVFDSELLLLTSPPSTRGRPCGRRRRGGGRRRCRTARSRRPPARTPGRRGRARRWRSARRRASSCPAPC